MDASLVVDLAAVLQADVVESRVETVDLRAEFVDSMVLGVVPSSRRSFPVEASYPWSGYS